MTLTDRVSSHHCIPSRAQPVKMAEVSFSNYIGVVIIVFTPGNKVFSSRVTSYTSCGHSVVVSVSTCVCVFNVVQFVRSLIIRTSTRHNVYLASVDGSM